MPINLIVNNLHINIAIFLTDLIQLPTFKFQCDQKMELLIYSVKEEQVPLFEELAKVLGLQLEKKNVEMETNQARIEDRIQGIEAGTTDLIPINWDEFMKNVHKDA